MKDEIAKIIAEYLNNKTQLKTTDYGRFREFNIDWQIPVSVIAAEIAEKLLPIVGEKDLPLSELFDHMANEHDLTLTNTELGDIIHIARGGSRKPGLQVGARVKIVAKIETNDRFAHHFQIGRLGTITRVDLSDPLYPYLIDDHDYGWVMADEIELIE